MYSIPLIVVEGQTDVPVVKRLLVSVGMEADKISYTGGKNRLDSQINKYNLAARVAPVWVLRDLDKDAPCAAQLVRKLVPTPEQFLILRIAVRASEAWLMADTEKLASFLHIPGNLVQNDPESLEHPKRALVELARRSTKPEVVRLMVPEEGQSGLVGPGYPTKLIEYTERHWRPEVARRKSSSLDRCMLALERLAERATTGGGWPLTPIPGPPSRNAAKPARIRKSR